MVPRAVASVFVSYLPVGLAIMGRKDFLRANARGTEQETHRFFEDRKDRLRRTQAWFAGGKRPEALGG